MACGGGWTPGPAAEFFDLRISQGLGRGAAEVCVLPALEGLAGGSLRRKRGGPQRGWENWEDKDEVQRAGVASGRKVS